MFNSFQLLALWNMTKAISISHGRKRYTLNFTLKTVLAERYFCMPCAKWWRAHRCSELRAFWSTLGGQVRGGACRRHLSQEACVLRKRGLIPSLHLLCPICFFSPRGRTTVPETWPPFPSQLISIRVMGALPPFYSAGMCRRLCINHE